MRMLGWIMLAAVQAAVVQVCVPLPLAQAQASSEAEARALFDAGAVAFSDGRFEDALERWEQSYALAELPALLFNMGTAHDRMGNRDQALQDYGEYLNQAPEASNANYVRRRIDILEREVSEESAPEERVETEPVHPPLEFEEPPPGSEEPPPEASLSVPAVITLSLGGALLVAGTVTGLIANGSYADLEMACPDGACAPEQQENIDSLGTVTLATDVLLIGGSVIAAVGLVWLLLSGDEEDTDSSEQVIRPSGLGVAGRF